MKESNMGNALRKLKKNIKKGKKPILMFFPDTKSIFDAKASGVLKQFNAPIVTVTDEKIHAKLLAGMEQAKKTKQHNVEEYNNVEKDL